MDGSGVDSAGGPPQGAQHPPEGGQQVPEARTTADASAPEAGSARPVRSLEAELQYFRTALGQAQAREEQAFLNGASARLALEAQLAEARAAVQHSQPR